MKKNIYIFSVPVIVIVFVLSAVNLYAASKTPQDMAEQSLLYFDKGMMFVETGDFKRAANMFRRSVSNNKNFSEAYNMLGFSLRKMGKYESAIKYYKKALEINPDFAEAHEYIGEAYLGLGDRDTSHEHYMILKKMGSKQAEVLMEKINEYDKKG
jgi:tetratricopeptide (TPR) repeat protein